MLVHLALVLVLLSPAVAFAQGPGRVDFRRDVLPIFREHCIGCHGPTQQMNGFRLDRRSAALRGGTFPVLVPGSSATSRVYLKLLGPRFGQQMPPTGPLAPAQIEIIRRWIDEGAEWPDDVAGETPPAPPDPAATRLMEAIRRGDSAAARRELMQNSAAARQRGTGGTTPLMYAALYGDLALLRMLLDHGADPNAANDLGATALMWATHDVEKTRLLLERGALTEARGDDGRTPLIITASRAGSAPVVTLLLDRGARAGASAGNGTTALREAANAADADVMALLIARGADLKRDAAAALGNALRARCRRCADLVIDAVDRDGLDDALLSLAIRGENAAVRLLLDRGANPHAVGGNGLTALMQACSSDYLPVDIVRLLLERGADVNAATRDGRTALDFAAQRNDPPILAALAAAGARRGRPDLAAVPKPMPVHTPRAAVDRALPLLQRTDALFTEKAGCLSCHHDALTALTVSRARQKGLKVDETIAASQLRQTLTYLESWRERALRGIGLAGGSTTVGYVLMGLGAERHPADAVTDAHARYLISRQLADGRMRVSAHRPPQEASDITSTAVSVRGIALYGGAEGKPSMAAAAKWLAAQTAHSAEEAVFQLLGLAWSGQHADRAQAIGKALLAEQRSDGGWNSLPALASDAYATGQALVALREAGVVTAAHPAYRRGVQFLLNTQLADGSWYVRSRSIPQQAYFESGFPHGGDQFISAAAANWAMLALLETLPAR
ncbi:MAG: ankyrin repeat domain-containing protein [Acidobacteria bacterium]|nr:ankyrin repeat domain-containing protein [Acidobacteriota bacterium]